MHQHREDAHNKHVLSTNQFHDDASSENASVLTDGSAEAQRAKKANTLSEPRGAASLSLLLKPLNASVQPCR